VMSQSSADSEYHAMANITYEMVRDLLIELGFTPKYPMRL